MPYKDKNKAREFNTKYKRDYRANHSEEVKEKDKLRYAKNRKHKLEISKKWRENNPEKVKKTRQKTYQNNKEHMKNKSRRLHILNNYNLTLNDFDNLLKSQNYKCAICGGVEPKGKGNFHIDHNHTTGKVRGLLCHKCNTGIGLLNDSVELLQKAIKYLESD